MSSFNRSHVLVAIVAGLVATATPTLARSVADFARNAGKVDGFSAVEADAGRRGRKLVATNRAGRLPDDIIAVAPDSDLLDGHGASAFVGACERGGIRGQANVPPTVGSTFEEVPGFSSSYGGPLDAEGNRCRFSDATARRVSVGVFDVRVAFVIHDCDGGPPPGILTAAVTVESATPLVGTYEPRCGEGNHVDLRVHVTNLSGQPVDAPFAVVLFDENGFPVP